MFIPPVGETDLLSASDPFVYFAFLLLLVLGFGFIATCLITRHSARRMYNASIEGSQSRPQGLFKEEDLHTAGTLDKARDSNYVQEQTECNQTEEMTFSQNTGGFVDWVARYHWRKLAEEEEKIRQSQGAFFPTLDHGIKVPQTRGEKRRVSRDKVQQRGYFLPANSQGYVKLCVVQEEDEI